MIEHSLRVLEYYRLLDILSRYAASPLGRSDCLSRKPFRDLESIRAEQRLVSEMKELLLVKGFVSLSNLADLRPVLKKAGKDGAYLDPKELLSIHNLLRVSHQARNWIRGARDLCPSLSDIIDTIPACSNLSREIGKSISEDGRISDRASPSLASVRSQRVVLRRAVEKKLDNILGSLDLGEENLISVRDGRYVVSVRTDKKNSLTGVVHSYSRTHSTCFMEPLAVVEENNEFVELTDKEREEERRVLQGLTRLVSDASSELLACLEIMGRIDGLFARAEFSKAIGGISPILCSDQVIYLLDARNPILLSLYLESSNGERPGYVEKVIPVKISLDAEKSILIVSGPNRGGKTVVLKTTGLLALMVQAGMHIPAVEGSRIGIFDNILAQIGDDQDIAMGLSTFSARMEHVKEILKEASENSLVILDELGTGTDPEEGASLAMAILDYLSEQGSLTALSTHYQKLKGYGLINKKAQNASVEFDYEKGKPTFRLLTGLPGVSHAIEIARDTGIMPDIIDKAVTYLGQERGGSDLMIEDLAQMLEQVKKEKDAVAIAKEEYTLSKKKLDEERAALGEHITEILDQKKKEAEGILAKAKSEFNKAIEFIKEKGPAGQAEATKRYLKTKGDLAGVMAEIAEPASSGNRAAFSPGQTIYHKQSKKSGVVLAVDETSAKARIVIGNVKLTVDSSELIPDREASPQREKDRRTGKQWSISSSSMQQKDLNLIGYKVADALPLVDKMIDQALVYGYTKVKIIHGVGSGTLRKAIREHLEENLNVRDFNSGGRNRVNDGITIVEL